jgi:hypothetical protein
MDNVGLIGEELTSYAEVIGDGVMRSSVRGGFVKEGMKIDWGGRCHPHRRKHCIAPILQIAVLPDHQLWVTRHGRHGTYRKRAYS